MDEYEKIVVGVDLGLTCTGAYRPTRLTESPLPALDLVTYAYCNEARNTIC
jgi:hypothetical protein